MDEGDSCSERRKDSCDVITKETLADLMPGDKGKTETSGLDSLEDIEKPILTKEEMNKSSQRKTQDESETIKRELQQHLQTRYVASGYFVHTFVFEHQHMDSSSFLYGILKIRTGDQLLWLRNEDATLLSHSEVLKLVETFSDATDEDIFMSNWRPDTDYITDIEFKVTISGKEKTDQSRETFVPIAEWKKYRTITLKKSKGSKFMQVLDDKIVFRKLISPNPDDGVCDLKQCHFIEEITPIIKEFDGMMFVRHYKSEENKNYLNVSAEGFFYFDKLKYTMFEICYEERNAFSKLREYQTDRYLCVNKEHENGQFVALDGIGNDSFKFDIKKLKCSRKQECSDI